MVFSTNIKTHTEWLLRTKSNIPDFRPFIDNENDSDEDIANISTRPSTTIRPPQNNLYPSSVSASRFENLQTDTFLPRDNNNNNGSRFQTSTGPSESGGELNSHNQSTSSSITSTSNINSSSSSVSASSSSLYPNIDLIVNRSIPNTTGGILSRPTGPDATPNSTSSSASTSSSSSYGANTMSYPPTPGSHLNASSVQDSFLTPSVSKIGTKSSSVIFNTPHPSSNSTLFPSFSRPSQRPLLSMNRPLSEYLKPFFFFFLKKRI